MKTLTLGLLLAVFYSANAQVVKSKSHRDSTISHASHSHAFDSNFAHTVYFWLKNPDDATDRKAFETSLTKFLNASAYAKTLFIGKPPRASRNVVDGSFTYSLILSFESAEAQQNYQNEAPHKVFIAESENLWKKVIVYDSQSI